MSNKLTRKRQAFVREYPEDFNGAQAAIRAGYSPKSAKQTASRLFTNVDIRAAIDEELDKISLRSTEILARLTDQATASVGDFFTVNPDGDRIVFDPEVLKDRGHLIKSVKARTTVTTAKNGDQHEYTYLELTLYDGQKALELLGKFRGMVAPKRIELTGKDGGPIEIDHAAAARNSLSLLIDSQANAREQKQVAGGINGR